MPEQKPTQFAFSSAFHEVLGMPANGDRPGLDQLCDHLEQSYSPACACGLAQQVGRAAFIQLLRGKERLEDLGDQSFRLLPGRMRLRRGLEKLENLIEEVFGIPVALVDEGEVLWLKTSSETSRNVLIPYLEAGFIQEFVHWVSGGHPHLVRVSAEAPGWSVRVGKQPLDS